MVVKEDEHTLTCLCDFEKHFVEYCDLYLLYISVIFPGSRLQVNKTEMNYKPIYSRTQINYVFVQSLYSSISLFMGIVVRITAE